MENYVLVDTEDNKYYQLDLCYAESKDSALTEFCIRGWVIGEVMTLADYQSIMLEEEPPELCYE